MSVYGNHSVVVIQFHLVTMVPSELQCFKVAAATSYKDGLLRAVPLHKFLSEGSSHCTMPSCGVEAKHEPQNHPNVFMLSFSRPGDEVSMQCPSQRLMIKESVFCDEDTLSPRLPEPSVDSADYQPEASGFAELTKHVPGQGTGRCEDNRFCLSFAGSQAFWQCGAVTDLYRPEFVLILQRPSRMLEVDVERLAQHFAQRYGSLAEVCM